MTYEVEQVGEVEGYKLEWSRLIRERGAAGVPPAVVFELTKSCDCGECPSCFMGAEHVHPRHGDGSFMTEKTLTEWVATIRPTPEEGPEEGWITGGEPLLDPNLGEKAQVLKNAGMRTVVVTNGELLADRFLAKRLGGSGAIDEFAISVRGFVAIHDLMMLSMHDGVWEQVDKAQSHKEQIKKAVRLRNNQNTRFGKTIAGIRNISKENVQVSLNMDMHAGADFEQIIDYIYSAGGRVDKVYLQVQQLVGRAKRAEGTPSVEWKKPTTEMIGAYMEQAKKLIAAGKLGSVEIIDPLPEPIVDELSLENEGMYAPESIPVIKPNGRLRGDVVG